MTFVWRGTAATRRVVIADGVAAGAGGVDPANSQMIRLADTDVWYRSYEVRTDARFTYKLSENDSMQSFVNPNRVSRSVVDPLNPRVYPTGHSYLELGGAPAQIGVAAPPAARTGITVGSQVASERTRSQRGVWVYTPAGFTPGGGGYPLIVVLDGGSYTTLVPVPAILDALIAAERIPPVVAVLVDTSYNRTTDLSCSGPFADFLALDLVPWARRTLGAGIDSGRTFVVGSSLGGLAATCAAFAHQGVFGGALSQSGSFWWKPQSEAEPEWLTGEIARAPHPPQRMFIEVGAMEIPDQLDTNRRLRDVLRAKGTKVVYREFNGNHTYLNWRGGFADGVVALLGRTRP